MQARRRRAAPPDHRSAGLRPIRLQSDHHEDPYHVPPLALALLPSNRRRWATVGVLAASAALAGRVSAALGPAAARVPRRGTSSRCRRPGCATSARRARRDDRPGGRADRRAGAGGHPVRHPAGSAVGGDRGVRSGDRLHGDARRAGARRDRVARRVRRDDRPTGDCARSCSGTGVSARETGLRQLTLAVERRQRVARGHRPTAARSPSPRYARPLSETPQTIQVIPRQVMEEQGVTTLSEALRNVPGITLQAGEGGGASNTAGDMFNLRGFNADNSLFVDGVRDDGLISRDVFNLEQVEVFMGPTGSDVGRGTAAGYVNMQTKTPHARTRLRPAPLGFGTADQRALTVDVNQALPLGDAGGVVARTGGAPQRAVAGRRRARPRRRRARDAGPSRRRSRSASARRRASPLGGQFMRQDNLPDYGIPGAAWADEPLAPTTVQAPQPGRPDQLLRQRRLRLRRASSRTATRRASSTTSAATDAAQPDPLQPRAARSGDHRRSRTSAAYDADDRAGDARAPGQRARERDHLEPDERCRRASRPDGCGTRSSAGSSSRARSSSRRRSAASARARRSTSSRPNPNDPVVGYAPARTGAFSRRQDVRPSAVYVFDTVDVGPAAAGDRRPARASATTPTFRAVDAAGVATDRPRRRTTRWSAARPALLFKLTDQRQRLRRRTAQR